MTDIKGSVALVTGGNRGIGEGFVRTLVAAGASKVYCGARNPDDAKHLVDEFGGAVVALKLDVTDEGQIEAAAKEATDVNIVINNAGAFLHGLLIGSPDISKARMEMEVNYFGVLNMSRAFAPVLKANGGGAIVNVLSAGGIVAVPNMGGYSPSKFAARAASTIIRAELADQGTHVAALIVGSVDTRMAEHVEGAKERPEDIAKVGLTAIKHKLDELDTDAMAVQVRANIQRDPKWLERQMARGLKAGKVSTGR